jgi:hypothetical protein
VSNPLSSLTSSRDKPLRFSRASRLAPIFFIFSPLMSNITQYYVQDGRKLGYGAMQGIPMVASSPVRHDSPIGVHPLEVQAYQPPWKALSDFALHADLEQPHQPAFQQLVNQVSNPAPLVFYFSV